MATFDKDDTSIKVIDIISDKLGIDKDLVTPVATFQSLGADSLDVVEMIMKLEEQFGLEIKDEEAEQLQTVDEVVVYINERRTK